MTWTTGSAFDEQAGQVDSLLEGSTTIPAKVEDHCIDVLFNEIFQDLTHVARGAAVVWIPAASTFHIQVEAGQVDDPDEEWLAGRFGPVFEDCLLGFAILEFDSVTSDVDHASIQAVLIGNFQSHDRTTLASDFFDDFAEFHIDDVLDFTVDSLPDPDNAVFRLQASLFIGGPFGDDLVDDGIAVNRPQFGTDAVKFERHLNLEVLVRTRGHVARVRIERHGHRGQIHFEEFVAIGLVHSLGETHIATADLLFLLLLGHFFFIINAKPQKIELDSLAPSFSRLSFIFCIMGFVGIAEDLFVDG